MIKMRPCWGLKRRRFTKLGGPSWRNELHPDSFLTGKLEENNASLLTDDLTVPMLIQMGEGDRLVSNEAIGNLRVAAGHWPS